MKNRSTRSMSRTLTAAGLVVAAAGISTLFAVRVAPLTALGGVALLLAVAALVAMGPWRWTPIAGVVVALFELVAALAASGTTYRLSHPEMLGGFIGTSFQLLGLATAVTAGIVATIRNYRAPTADLSR